MSNDLSAKHEMEERKMITASQDSLKSTQCFPSFCLEREGLIFF